MPELPEVETIKNGILPHLKNTTIKETIVREYQLRWPIPKNLNKKITGNKITDIQRRAKYLLLSLEKNNTPTGLLIIHLGMSGNLRITDKSLALKKHDHVDLKLSNNKILRYNDPRRFGAILWIEHHLKPIKNDPIAELSSHERFSHLGPEPLTNEFNYNYILNKAKNRKTPVKNFIMNNEIVVGVGNIYATEALFFSKINPFKAVGEITDKQWQKLITEIKRVLNKAIKSGGTTLKDFTNSDGKPGYFKQELVAYGRTGEPCITCKNPLLSARQ